MKKTKKILALALAAVMLVCTTVAATVAYLTSQTEVVNNTFTVGKVKILLNEEDTDNDNRNDVNYVYTIGDATKNRDTSNEYHIIPGAEFDKDPTISIKADSEKSYVRALVTIKYKAAADKVLNLAWLDLDNETWAPVGNPTTTRATVDGVEWITRVYELRYKEVVDLKTTTADFTKVTVKEGTSDIDYYMMPALFTEIVVPGNLTNTQVDALEGLEIDVVAHAIQASGMESAADAWSKW